MNRKAPIIIAFALGLLPLGALAANLDDVTMHVLDANQHAVDVTNNIQIPDQATKRSENRNEKANEHADNGDNPDSMSGDTDPGKMNEHAVDAIEGTPASGRRGGN
jgi:hypothetical protein